MLFNEMGDYGVQGGEFLKDVYCLNEGIRTVDEAAGGLASAGGTGRGE